MVGQYLIEVTRGQRNISHTFTRDSAAHGHVMRMKFILTGIPDCRLRMIDPRSMVVEDCTTRGDEWVDADFIIEARKQKPAEPEKF